MAKVRVTIRFEYEIDEDYMVENYNTSLLSRAVALDKSNLIAGFINVHNLSDHAIVEDHVRFEVI